MSPFPCKKVGQLLKDNWGLSEENLGKWQSSRFLQNDAFFWPQGPSMQARLIFGIREKSKIWAKYTFLQHVKWSKSWLVNKTVPFCMGIFLLAPIHSVGFLQGPADYSYKKWALTCQGEFQRGGGQIKISPYKMVRFCLGAALPLPCVFLTQPSIVFKEQPILFERNWAQWYFRPVFLQCWQKVKRSYPFFFCTRFVLESRADSDKWHGVAFWNCSGCNSAAAYIWRYMYQHCKLTGRKYHWAHYLTRSMGCPWSERREKCREMAEQQVLTKWYLFWVRVQACKQDSYSEK